MAGHSDIPSSDRLRPAPLLAEPYAADAVLDLACGTGQLAAAFARAGVRRRVGVDFCPEMITIAKDKAPHPACTWVEADMTALPMGNGTFDIVSIAFGLRNAVDPAVAAAEAARVLRPGGRMVVLEVVAPPAGPRGRAGRVVLDRRVPLSGHVLFGDRSGGYKYLSASTRTFVAVDALRQIMIDAGFISTRVVRRFACGRVALLAGRRP